MKILLFFIIVFGLPHSMWVPLRLNIPPEQIPLGVMNWIFFAAILLWLIGNSSGVRLKNSIKLYNVYVVITCLSVISAFAYQFEGTITTLTTFKNQTILLLLYYIPLSSIKDEDEFRKYFYIMVAVNFLIGWEVVRSGVLAGIHFNDSKRGSGPFSPDLLGSDVAGAYLAQGLMFVCAIILSPSMRLYQRACALIFSMVMMLGVYATYARGALIGCAAGLAVMFTFLGFQKKYLVIIAILLGLAYMFMPESIEARFDKTRTESGELDASTQGRLYYYGAALDILLKNPLGIGIGQMRGAMESQIGKHVDPHNAFLYTACEYGILGLGVFLAMLVSVYRQAKGIWSDPSLPAIYRTYALGIAGFIGSFVACNMVYANFYKELVMGTTTIYLGMAAFIVAHVTVLKDREKQ